MTVIFQRLKLHYQIKSKMQIIIPMSGQGKRFKEAGYPDPKPLILVDGSPIIKHVIDLFPGETNIHCICNEEHLATTDMRATLLNVSPGVKIHSIPSHSLGPVHAVLSIADTIRDDDEVIVSYCDYGTVWNYAGLLSEMRGLQADGGIAAYRGFHPHMLGKDNYAFMRHEDEWMIEIREKEPFTTDRMSEYASNGTYYFRNGAILKQFCRELVATGVAGQKNGEYYMSLVYNCMVAAGQKVRIFEIERMLQWGTPHDLEVYKMWSAHFARKPEAAYESSATLVLPMAGRGSRFMVEGFSNPKPLLDVAGKPMILRAVESIPHTQSQVFICLKEHLESYPVREQLEETFPGCKIVVIDDVTEGQACTCEIGILQAGLAPDEPIMISACDNGVDYNKAAYKALEEDPTVDVIVWSFTNNPTGKHFPQMYAWMDVDETNGDIRHVSVKKPLQGARHAIIGTMFFRRTDLYMKGLDAIYKSNTRTNGEFYVDNLLNPLIEMGHKVKVFEADAYICWGTPADYRTYNYWLNHFR